MRFSDDSQFNRFKAQELDLDENSTDATLTGDTTDGKHIMGTDTVNVVS